MSPADAVQKTSSDSLLASDDGTNLPPPFRKKMRQIKRTLAALPRIDDGVNYGFHVTHKLKDFLRKDGSCVLKPITQRELDEINMIMAIIPSYERAQVVPLYRQGLLTMPSELKIIRCENTLC